jgi:hypothetical protein
MGFTRIRKVVLYIDGEKSTGIYAGANGQVEIDVPNHKEFGYMAVETKDGDLRLTFAEHGIPGKIVADMKVEGEKSTGMYHNARGDLKFDLDMYITGMARGTYWGTLWLEHEPAKTAAHVS